LFTLGTKLPEELVNSPHMRAALEKHKKMSAEKQKALKKSKKKWDDENPNQKTLLEILTKRKRK